MENLIELDNSQYEVAEARDPAVIAAEINAIKSHTSGILAHAVFEIGKRLCEAKERVPFGEWAGWLKDNVDYSDVTARRLMRAYREFGGEAEALEEGEAAVFEGLNLSQMVALLPLPGESRAEFVSRNNIQEKSSREIQELVTREKQAMAEKEKLEAEVEDLRQFKTKAVDSVAKMQQEKSKLSEKVTKLTGQLKETKEAKREEVLAEVNADLAVKADPDVQGITFNLGDLSERVQKIDVQLAVIAERDAALAKTLKQKVSTALVQIFGAVEWSPWKVEDVEIPQL